jgi:hypothetical protein
MLPSFQSLTTIHLFGKRLALWSDRWGYRVATFASAEDFLQSDSINEASRLISDVQTPGMSGVDLQCLLIVTAFRPAKQLALRIPMSNGARYDPTHRSERLHLVG